MAIDFSPDLAHPGCAASLHRPQRPNPLGQTLRRLRALRHALCAAEG
jgi:hypothetical protein